MALINSYRKSTDCAGGGCNSGVGRRSFLKSSLFSFMGLSAMNLLRATVLAEGENDAKCDAVIFVLLGGAASQFETFDPKGHKEFGGPHKAIATSADGIEISGLLP